MVDADDIISAFRIYYRELSVQDSEQYENEEAGDADIPYPSFVAYLELATDELNDILTARKISLTEAQTKVAYCHLIADYFEMGNPDWSFRSESMGSGVSFSRGDETGPRAALNKLLDQVAAAERARRIPSARPPQLMRTKDHTNYPRRYKRTEIPSFDYSSSGFDSAPTSDY